VGTRDFSNIKQKKKEKLFDDFYGFGVVGERED
jgi:hypothetical protein